MGVQPTLHRKNGLLSGSCHQRIDSPDMSSVTIHNRSLNDEKESHHKSKKQKVQPNEDRAYEPRIQKSLKSLGKNREQTALISSLNQEPLVAVQQREKEKQKKAIRILLVAFIAFMVCSLPYNTFYVTAIAVMLTKNKIDNAMLDANVWFSMLYMFNPVTNCFVYAGLDTKFRKFCKDSITGWCLKRDAASRLLNKTEKRKNRPPTLSINI